MLRLELDDTFDKKLHELSRRTGWPKEKIVSAALRQYLDEQDGIIPLTERVPQSRTHFPRKRINLQQRQILITVASLLIFMLVFPPFIVMGRYGQRFLGYFPIFDPPSEPSGTINLMLLAFQYLVVIIVGAIGWFLAGKGNESN